MRLKRALVATMLVLLALSVPVAPARAGLLDRLLGWVSNSISTQGLSIHWGGTLTAQTLELRDSQGTYATFEGVRVVWSPLALIRRDILVDRLEVDQGDIARLPVSSGGSSGSGLPGKLSVKALEAKRLTIEKPVVGVAAVLRLSGSGSSDASVEDARLELSARRLDGNGAYDVSAQINATTVTAKVTAQEGPRGLIATLAGIPDIGPLDLSAQVNGPESALVTQVALAAGQLRAGARGQVDLPARTLALHVDANAPAMAPRPDLGWQSVAVNADVNGPFATPDVNATLRADGLHAGEAGARTVALDVRGNKGDLRLSGQLDGVTVPGKRPDMLAAAPLRLDGQARLAEPGRPVRFALHHPILDASGSAQLDTEQGEMQLTLPDLAPFAASAGEELQGRAALRLTGARQQSGALALDLNGTLGITGGRAPVPALVGGGARIEAAASVQGGSVSLSRLAFDGQDVSLSAAGSLSSARLDLRFATALPRLEPVDPRLQGGLHADGRVSGPATDLAVAVTLGGEVSAAGQPSGPFTARLTAQGLPGSPDGSLTAQGTLLGAPIDVALAGGRAADGALQARIERADWKSLAATGAIALPAGATLPQGQLRLSIGSLADFAPLLGRPLAGGASATLDATAAAWRLDAQATNAGEPGTASIGKGVLRLTLDHPSNAPVVDGQLSLDGVKAAGIAGSARLGASGPTDALALTLAADLANLNGAPARVTGKGTADATARSLALSDFAAAWKGQTLRLLAPVTFGFAQGVQIESLRLGMQRAVIAVNGRVGQTIDLTAQARDVPASLAALVSPSLDLSGTLNADARLGGTASAPTGTIRARASGLRLNTAQAPALPAADVTVSADLAGDSARIDLRATAGASRVSVMGRTGLSTTAPVDLRADGSLDLAEADPLLGAGER
ncbi:MAG: hypothetical protein JO118_03565, partial [Acetobacteraceae bacterium]|nr:hypothetical protein [Acetobacteraceae bacterium]